MSGRAKAACVSVLATATAVVLLILPRLSWAGAPGHRLEPSRDFALPPATGTGPTVVRSADLVENAREWNEHSVSFTGEAIGEKMIRGGMAWIHLNDDAYMWRNIEEGAVLGGYSSGHAVWLPADDARKIAVFGDYKHEGDVVRAIGTFHAACPEHGGDMDIHAGVLEVIQPGHAVDNPLNRPRLILALALMLLSGGLFIVRRIARRKRI